MKPLEPFSTDARSSRDDQPTRGPARGVVLAVPVAALLWAIIALIT